MGWFARLNIASKLSVMVASVIFLLSLLSGLILWSSLSEVMRQDLETRGKSIAMELSQLSSEPIQMGNLYALEELVYMAKNNNEFVEYVFVIDPQNRIMAHTFRNGIPKNLLGLYQEEQADLHDIDIREFHSSIGQIDDIICPIEDGSLGYVRLGVNEKSLVTMLAKNIFKLVCITLAVGLLGAFFVFRLAHVFTRPLEKLIRRAETISAGGFPQRHLAVHSEDEFGRLTAAMNTMADSLHTGEIERKKLLGHLLNVQENERKRISMEIHDESGQALTALILSIRALANQTEDEEQKEYILAVRDETYTILQRLRHLAVELRPPALDELGIEAAVQNLISSYEKFDGLTITFNCSLQQQPDSMTSLALYRIVQECLTNIIKHAQATQASITLTGESIITLTVKDNGVGITEEAIRKARETNHLGIYGMQERIQILGGTMEITSEEPEWKTVYIIALRAVTEGRRQDV
jgi:signal transduction histidine kinase